MAPDESTNGWAEYRRMVISWHEDEVRERQTIKSALEAYQESNRQEHAEIMKTLTELSTEKAQTRRWIGPVMAAVVAAAVSWLFKLLP